MNAPERRLWLFPRHPVLEVFVFGPLDEMAPVAAAVKCTLEHWPGWSDVRVIASGDHVAGFEATITSLAINVDLTAEFVEAALKSSCRTLRTLWWTATPAGGIVGRW